MLGKREKRAVLEWLLEKHGLKKRLVKRRARATGKKTWIFSGVQKRKSRYNWPVDFGTFSDKGEAILMGIEDPCCSRHKFLDCLLEWNKMHGRGISVAWHGDDEEEDMLLKKEDTLESLAMQYELENGSFEECRGSKRRGDVG